MNALADRRILLLHLGVIALLFASQFVLPAYHHTNMARIMVLACFAVGYNILIGYTGMMSLGHAMFFAAGAYGAGLTIHYFGFGAPLGFLIGVVAGLGLALLVGLVALRTRGVSFMIVTLMFAQACHLLTLYLNDYTGGDEGIGLRPEARIWSIGGMNFDLSHPATRFNVALVLFSTCFIGGLWLVRSGIGRVLVAIRENEDRARLLGYNTFRYKLLALAVSGAMSGASGAAFVLLFSYFGSTFASIQYSILPLLWVLVGGAGTTLGPLAGTLLMFYLVDKSSELTSSYMFVVGATLVLLVLLLPKGIFGTMRQRLAPWLP